MGNAADPATPIAGGPAVLVDDPAAARIHERRWLTLGVLCLSLLLIVAGNSSLNVALPDIQTRLGSSASSLQWIADVYGLVFAGLLLPAGAFADRFGRKTALQGGLVLFAVAAMVATFGTETWHLILARAVMGVGAAFIMPGTLSILTNVFKDPLERRKAISIWAGFAGLGGALGTLVSGFLLEHYSWASTFLVNVPICLVALVAGLWLVPNSSDPSEAVLDPPGAVLAVAGLATLLYGIIEAPGHGWASPETLGTVGIAVVLLAAFVWWELRCDHPMLDVRLFKNRSFAIGSSTITLQYMAMFGLYFALAQYLQFAHGYSALETALIGLPIGIFAMVGAPLSAKNVARFGPRRVVGTGLLVSGSGLLVLGLTSSATVSVLVIIVGFSLVGLGNGQTTAPSTTLIMGSVPRAKSGVGSAVNDLSRELGGALGIAVLGSVMSSIYRSEIGGRLTSLPQAVQAKAHSSIVATFDAADAAGKRGDSSTAQLLVQQGKEAFGTAFGRTMLLATAVIFVNAAIVWTFQGRHRGAVAPDPADAGTTAGPDGSAAAAAVPAEASPVD
ncbi:DHA2 family efflux MFS transporter permease subunit [Aquihabitans sp. G128]|uniref:DHA2 family efflux MFS transporter permease subunit n=1 Tax=Aquihabitans sp. G128 TaxID=2849779 RepID=UPI001C21DF1A|nr:DHA2 family efflux MFS transporter permease subunit [Aquihabitans sp. G128]QXC59234.1 DHA2 family efflux MFS transporter permease subunit [Aquihabitans sp. G128]